jgi:hypothetical protein
MIQLPLSSSQLDSILFSFIIYDKNILLIQKLLDKNKDFIYDSICLRYASVLDKVDTVKLLLKHCNILDQNCINDSILYKSYNVLSFFVEHYKHIIINKNTLDKACSIKNNTLIIKLLINNGCVFTNENLKNFILNY